jgi:hypothetical protein
VCASASEEVSEKLREIGGEGPWKVRLDRILDVLGVVDEERPDDEKMWSEAAARNRIRHLIRFEQTPTPEQFIDVITAHALHCAAELEAQRARDQRLKASINRFISLAERADAAVFGPSIRSYGAALDRLRQLDSRPEAGPPRAPPG